MASEGAKEYNDMHIYVVYSPLTALNTDHDPIYISVV